MDHGSLAMPVAANLVTSWLVHSAKAPNLFSVISMGVLQGLGANRSLGALLLRRADPLDRAPRWIETSCIDLLGV